MIQGITYTDEHMTISAERCKESMLKHGVNDVKVYTEEDIEEDFQWFNKEIFDGKRGSGCYWLFKPYFIYRSISEMQENDILVYSDAGVEFINDVQYIIDQMDQDIFFFSNGHKQVEWCKGSIMDTILPEWRDGRYDEFKQVQASVIFFKVNQNTRDFVKEWLLYCQMPGFIDDSPSKAENVPTFAEHRHDQAILCALQIKYAYRLHWWPARYNDLFIFERGEFKDVYPILVDHHRKRNSEYNLQPA